MKTRKLTEKQELKQAKEANKLRNQGFKLRQIAEIMEIKLSAAIRYITDTKYIGL